MGQSRNRLLQMQSICPWCVYCGQRALGTTVDHMPPITIFNRRQRPKGLEFLACADCHQGTRILDQLASVYCRMYPGEASTIDYTEYNRLYAGIRNNFPNFDAEFEPTHDQNVAILATKDKFPGAATAFNIGPKVLPLMYKFAARVGYALHYELTKSIIPQTGGVLTRLFTNYHLATGEFPSDMTAMLGPARTLKQGSKTIGDQFRYKSWATERGDVTVHQAFFRLSFAIHVVAARNHDRLIPTNKTADHLADIISRIFRPGFLSGDNAGPSSSAPL